MTEHLPLNTAPLPLKLRVEDYLLLDRSGAFDAYAKTELIEGEIVFMNAQHRPHARVKMKLYDSLRDNLARAGAPLTALVEASIEAPPTDVPEPDILVTSEPDGEGLVPVASVALIVEIADTSLANDLGRKAALYARLGVPEYWVGDVNGRSLHQLWTSAEAGYAERRAIPFGAPIQSATIDWLVVEIS
jgi:Uma2 family endonuclease